MEDPFVNPYSKKKKETTPEKSGVAPFVNPYSKDVSSAQPQEDPDSFSNKVGNFGSYLNSLMSRKPEEYAVGLSNSATPVKNVATDVLNFDKKAVSAISSIPAKVTKTVGDVSDVIDNSILYLGSTPISRIGSDALAKIKDTFKSSPGMTSIPAQLAGGAIDMFLQTPIEAATQMNNENGVATPMTPDQLSQKYLAVAGTLAMGKVAHEVSSSLLPTQFSSQEAALAAQKVSRVGKLAKISGADAMATAAAGGVQSGIANLGQDDDLQHSVIGALTFAPIGAAFGLFGLKEYNEKVNLDVGKSIGIETPENAKSLAALNTLRPNDQTSMSDLANNIDAINTSDNLLNAAIKAKFKIGQGFVVPDFKAGDKLPEIPGGYAYHSPANNSLLALPYELNSEGKAFFTKNGFLPREVVNYGGNDNYVVGAEGEGRLKLKDINTGQETVAPLEAIRRTNSSITSSTFNTTIDTQGLNQKLASLQDMASKTEPGIRLDGLNTSINAIQDQLSSKSVKVTKAGILNPSNYLDRIASSFATYFQKNQGADSFDNLLAKYAQKAGIESKDIPFFSSAVYKRIGSDLVDSHLSSREKAVRMRVRTELEVSNQDYVNDLSKSIYNAAFSNGMIISHDGQGRYDIKFRDGTKYASVGSPEEALSAINKSGQINSNPLDGGSTGAIPTNIANNGGMSQPFEASRSKIQDFADKARLGAIGKIITPAPKWLTLFDNVSGSTNLLQQVVEPIQALVSGRKNFISQSEPITVQLNKTLQLAKGFSPGDLLKISDNIKTLSAEEIQRSLLSRPMLGTEVSVAKKWFKGISTKAVTDLMYSTKAAHNFDIGSPEYTDAVKLVGEANKYDPKVIKAAQNLSAAATQLPLDVFSPYAVLRLAKAYEDPSTALTRDQHAAKYLTPQMRAVADQFTKLYDMYDIDPTQKIKGYVPDIPIYNAVGGKGVNINPAFAREMTKVGITSSNNLISNPIEQAIKYHYSYLDAKSGFLDGLDKINKAANNNIDILSKHTDPDIAKLASPLRENLDSYINSVAGKMNPDELLSKISSTLTSQLGLRTPDVGSLLHLFSLSNLALRFGLAIRDVHNALGASYMNNGHEFAEKAFTYALSNEVMKDLRDKGIITIQDASQIIDPLKPQNLMSKDGPLGQLSSFSFRASGQLEAYNRTAAGIYMATRELGAKELRDLQSNKISKAEAYSNMKLSNHGPAVQTAFDNLVQAGKPDEALDLLGRWNIRKNSIVFGAGNAPISWNNPVGRLFGQYGMWPANAANNLLEAATYGSKADIAGRVLRGGIVYGATAAAGATLGLNLHSWQFMNPMEVMPGVGPVATVMKDAANTYSKDPNALDAAFHTIGGVASKFVPFRKVASDWLGAMDQSNVMAGILNAPVK